MSSLGVSRLAHNTAVLALSQVLALQHQVEERVLRYIGRFRNSQSSMLHLEELLNCPNFEMGFFAAKVVAEITPPCYSPPLVLDSSRIPHLRVVSDDPINTRTKAATVGYVIHAFNVELAGGLHVFASTMTAELVTTVMALQHLRTLDHSSSVVPLADLRSPLLQLSNLNQDGLLEWEVG